MQNKYLVVMCIDETDTNEPDHIIPKDKSKYDIVLLSYSKDESFNKHLLNFHVPIYYVNSGKWKNIKLYFDKKGFGEYLYYFFPDPDLKFGKSKEEIATKIEKIFEFGRLYNFDLFQPALSLRSIGSHEFLYKKGDSFRPVKFVEVMCPCFSKKALKKLLTTFKLSFSGYGLDLLWSKYYRGFVLDFLTVDHLRRQNFKERAKEKGFPDPDYELEQIKKIIRNK